MGGKPLNKPIVGIAADPRRRGYWLVASDGGIFAFGDASSTDRWAASRSTSRSSASRRHPTATATTRWPVDGGIFTFPTVGGPPFLGSAGSLTLNKPVVGMAVAADGGYYMVASDGGIFSYPSTEALLRLDRVHQTQQADRRHDLVSNGYYLGAADGGVFAFPRRTVRPSWGAEVANPSTPPIVAISG